MINIAFFFGQKEKKRKESILDQLHSDFYLEKAVKNEILSSSFKTDH